MPIWNHALYIRNSNYDTWTAHLATNTGEKSQRIQINSSALTDWLNAGFTITSWSFEITSDHATDQGRTPTGSVVGLYSDHAPNNALAQTSGNQKRVTKFSSNYASMLDGMIRYGDTYHFTVKVGATGSRTTVWLAFPQVIINLTKTTTVTAGNKIYASDAYVVVGGTTYKARSDVGVGNPIKYGSTGTTITASYWNSVTITI